MPQKTYTFGEFLVDPQGRRLEFQGAAIPLTAKAFDLLLLLVENSGQPVSKETLIAALWPDTVVEENNLSQHVFQLRKALSKQEGGAQYVQTLPKIGFQFVEPVRVVEIFEHTLPAPKFGRWWVLALAVLAVLGAGGGGWLWYQDWRLWNEPVEAGLPPSVAVLPFRNLTGDPGKDYWMAAFAGEIAGAIGRLEGVTAQSVSQRELPVDDLVSAGKLRADYVFSGSLKGQGPFEIELHFLNARRKQLVWSRRFQTTHDELAKTIFDISSEVSGALQETAGAKRRTLLGRKPPRNAEAYLSFLAGMQALESRSSADLTKALDAFQQSITSDSTFAGAYAGLAFTIMVQAIHGDDHPMVAWPRAIKMAEKALSLEPDLPEALMVKTQWLAHMELDEAAGEQLARKLAADNPASQNVQLFLGYYLSSLGKFQEAEPLLRRAVQSDPTSLIARQQLAYLHYRKQDLPAAKLECLRIIRLNPKSVIGYGILMPVLWMNGEYRMAELLVDRARKGGLNQPVLQMAAGYTYAKVGRIAEARQIRDNLLEASKSTYVQPLQLSILSRSLGDHELARELREKCIRDHCVQPSILRTDPMMQ